MKLSEMFTFFRTVTSSNINFYKSTFENSLFSIKNVIFGKQNKGYLNFRKMTIKSDVLERNFIFYGNEIKNDIDFRDSKFSVNVDFQFNFFGKENDIKTMFLFKK